MGSGIVAKFGGSSVREAAAMRRCMNIVKASEQMKVVILSATYNTTNELEEVATSALKSLLEANSKLFTLRAKHLTIAKNLEVTEYKRLVAEVDQIIEVGGSAIRLISQAQKLTPEIMDEIYALGERLSTVLFSHLLHSKYPNHRVLHVDARKLITTDDNFNRARPLIDKIRSNVWELLSEGLRDKDTLIVTQGFIGATEDGKTTTLGREGSDFSGALLAEAIDAELLQIWTDTPGVAIIDPKIVPNNHYLSKMSYADCSLMARLGAKILFPDTIDPILRKNIPLFVGSSLNPELGGTWIGKSSSENELVAKPFIGISLINQKDLHKNFKNFVSLVPDGMELFSLIGQQAQPFFNSNLEVQEIMQKLAVRPVKLLEGQGHFSCLIPTEYTKEFCEKIV